MSDEQIEGFKNTFLMFDKELLIFKYLKTGVAGAVLQTALFSLTHGLPQKSFQCSPDKNG